MPARATRTVLDRSSPAAERAPEFVRLLSKAYPDAHVALRFSNPLEMLFATILSAQTTDERVNQVTEKLFRKYHTPEDYLRVSESELAADIKPTGFFNQKTRSLRGAAQRVVDAPREHAAGVRGGDRARRAGHRARRAAVVGRPPDRDARRRRFAHDRRQGARARPAARRAPAAERRLPRVADANP